MRIWTDKDGCSGCDYCGMDMDMEPFCVHPKVVKKYPYGLVINSAIKDFCGNDLSLWKKRRKQSA